MTANNTEAETDKAIPLDKLPSRVDGQTGRAGYVVFVLNIGRMINISNIVVEGCIAIAGKPAPTGSEPKHSRQNGTKPVGAGLPAKADYPPTSLLNVKLPSRAGSLPHVAGAVRNICGPHKTLWERACSR
jgi:hypothetical protein